MAERFVVRLHTAQDRDRARKALTRAPDGYVVRFDPPTRSVRQNARLWALLAIVAKEVSWDGEKLAPEEWKDVFTAALKSQRIVPGIDGGLVLIGARTSKFSAGELADLMALIEAFAAQRGVDLGDVP